MQRDSLRLRILLKDLTIFIPYSRMNGHIWWQLSIEVVMFLTWVFISSVLKWAVFDVIKRLKSKEPTPYLPREVNESERWNNFIKWPKILWGENSIEKNEQWLKNQSGIDLSSCFFLWNNFVGIQIVHKSCSVITRKKNSSLLWDFTKKVTVNFVGLESRLSFVCLRVCTNTWTRKPLTPLKRYFHHPPPFKVSRAERLKLTQIRKLFVWTVFRFLKRKSHLFPYA